MYLVLISEACFPWRIECRAVARLLRLVTGLVSSAMMTGKDWSGWAKPCLIVKLRTSTAAPWFVDVGERAASRTWSRYRCTMAELTLQKTMRFRYWGKLSLRTQSPQNHQCSLLIRPYWCWWACLTYPLSFLIDEKRIRVWSTGNYNSGTPFNLAEFFSDSDTKNSCMILSKRPLPSSSGEAKMASMTLAERSLVIKVGCARNRKPVHRRLSEQAVRDWHCVNVPRHCRVLPRSIGVLWYFWYNCNKVS